MKFSHLVRRTHLYLALFCLPWFVMYGITSVAFTHPSWFDTEGRPWVEDNSWPCTLDAPEGNDIPRGFGAELIKIAGIDAGAFGAYRSGPQSIDVYFPSFWETKRLSYDIEAQRLKLFVRESIPQHKLTGMHARAGYQHDGFWNFAWAVMVDVVAIGFLLWVITGIYIWWQLPGMRGWGLVGLGAGLLAFVAFFFVL